MNQGFDFSSRLTCTLDDAFDASVAWAKGQTPLFMEATDITRVCRAGSGALEGDVNLNIDCFSALRWKHLKARDPDSTKMLESVRVLWMLGSR